MDPKTKTRYTNKSEQMFYICQFFFFFWFCFEFNRIFELREKEEEEKKRMKFDEMNAMIFSRFISFFSTLFRSQRMLEIKI